MRTQYYTATSIDGYIADADNSLEWLLESDRHEADGTTTDHFASFFADVGAFCMGATTYEWVLRHEDVLRQPDKWTRWYAQIPCWVFTHRHLPAVPDTPITFVSGDVVPVHDAMATAAAGRNIWIVGGGELVGRFADAGRLDDLILGVAPVTLGTGAPLLPRRLVAGDLELVAVAKQGQFANLHYAVRR